MGKNRSNRRRGGTNETSSQNEYREFTTEDGKHTINVREITDKREFLKILEENTKNIPSDKRWRVDSPQTEKEIKDWLKWHEGVKMYVTENGTTGAVMPNGDMIALSSSVSGEGAAMFEWQIQHGGRMLDSYDGNYGLYRHLGVMPVSYTPFNEQYAKGWNKYTNRPEDVVFMVYGGKGAKSTKTPAQLEQELKDWKGSHTAQLDSANGPDNVEYGYDKAEEQRSEFLKDNKYLTDIWKEEGL